MQALSSFWKNLWALIKPFWTSEEKWAAYGLLAGVLACNIIQVRLVVLLNRWRKHFYDSLQAFQMHYVLLSLYEFLIILVLAILIFSYGNYFGGLLINRWRRWMTERYISHWLGNNVAYAMQILNKNMDNPDQRISEDLNEFPQLTLSLFSGLFSAILTFVSFSIILWQLSGVLVLSITGHHQITIPGYMFFATVIYASLGTTLMLWIGKNLMRLNYQQEQFNANFRFGLIRVREAAEQISLYQGSENEKSRLMHLFSYVFQNFFAIVRLQKFLAFFSNGYSLSVQIIGILIALPRYIHERLAIGSLIQVSTAFEQVVDALSFIVSAFTTIANWRAVIQRLTEFTRLMHESARESTQKQLQVTFGKASAISVEQLQLVLPTNEILVETMNFVINRGEHVLINGSYGSGKSTLLRMLANIWPYGTGNITLPDQEKLLFLPQKPYFPLGTLKQALIYPEKNTAMTDAQLKEVLADCGLVSLQDHLAETRYWSAEFSLGEQQLIAFARIFIYQPDWVFLDEATSALDEQTEKTVYQLLQTRFPAMTIISVGHRSSLRQFHTREITVPKRMFYPKKVTIQQGTKLHANGQI